MAQAVPQSRNRFAVSPRWIFALVVLAALVVVGLLYRFWLPPVQGWITNLRGLGGESKPTAAKEEEAGHGGHDHGHSGHAEESSIELSEQARKNIGLQLKQINLETFTRTVTVPGIIVERPGQSLQQVTAPLTGIVTRIYAIQGEAIESGQKLFEIRLTHEEVVQAQADLLRTVEELAVNEKEIERLQKVAAGGGPGKTLIEREYEQQKQLAVLRAQRQTLLLHGLTEDQVAAIEKDRALLPKFTVFAPETSDNMSVFQLEDLKVTRGQHVNAGDALAILTDHSQLYIEGNAFERDAKQVSEAAAKGLALSAYVEVDGEISEPVSDLKILYIANQVDPESRTLHFYAELPNKKLREREGENGKRFIAWRFRTGQRMQLQVPVETWKDQIVLPVNAIAQEAAEAYVFVANGDHFDRRPVHVMHRDPVQVVVANDGAIFPGDTVAASGAQQLQLALKNKAGGGIDPHAGHNH